MGGGTVPAPVFRCLTLSGSVHFCCYRGWTKSCTFASIYRESSFQGFLDGVIRFSSTHSSTKVEFGNSYWATFGGKQNAIELPRTRTLDGLLSGLLCCSWLLPADQHPCGANADFEPATRIISHFKWKLSCGHPPETCPFSHPNLCFALCTYTNYMTEAYPFSRAGCYEHAVIVIATVWSRETLPRFSGGGGRRRRSLTVDQFSIGSSTTSKKNKLA